MKKTLYFRDFSKNEDPSETSNPNLKIPDNVKNMLRSINLTAQTEIEDIGECSKDNSVTLTERFFKVQNYS